MKRIMILIVALLMLLCGCSASDDGNQPEISETQLEVRWLKEQGKPWDQDGVLQEIPINIPAGMQYSNVLEFGGDLLAWSVDDHLLDQVFLELCLISLDDGSVIACRDIPVGGYAVPQPLGDSLYICDNYSGLVLQLDQKLADVRTWKLEPNEDRWYFGGNGRIYQSVQSNWLWVYDTETEKFEPVLDGDPQISFTEPVATYLPLEYYDANTGTLTYAILDLMTGEVTHPEKAEHYGAISAVGDVWISERMGTPFTYRYCNGVDAPVSFCTDGYYVRLLQDKLLLTSDDSKYLHLYDLNGNPLSSCQVSETGCCMTSNLIWNEEQGGYYLVLYTFDSNLRLLFWDISRGTDREKLTFETIPEPSQEEAALLQRCEQIGIEHGLTVWIGDNCDTNFFDFTASTATDWVLVDEALDDLEDVLDDYPAGFFRQLQRKSPQGLQIQLVCDLEALADTQYTGDYAAFVEEHWDCSLMVVDIEKADTSTYYHEISHVIDSFVDWDSWEREDAIFSEADWGALNPAWFTGYTYDYSVLTELDRYGAFVDSYSTISPTEDRARIMEYAMSDYGQWTFEDAPILRRKLEYYNRCIRDAFDTTGWPLVTKWEQYLNNGVG